MLLGLWNCIHGHPFRRDEVDGWCLGPLWAEELGQRRAKGSYGRRRSQKCRDDLQRDVWVWSIYQSQKDQISRLDGGFGSLVSPKVSHNEFCSLESQWKISHTWGSHGRVVKRTRRDHKGWDTEPCAQWYWVCWCSFVQKHSETDSQFAIKALNWLSQGPSPTLSSGRGSGPVLDIVYLP